MLLGTLGATLLESMLASTCITGADEGTIRASQNQLCHPILLLVMKQKDIIRLKKDLIVFI